MRKTVEQETKLTVSAGIAPNKVKWAILYSKYDIDSIAQDACQGDWIVISYLKLILTQFVIRFALTRFVDPFSLFSRVWGFFL